MRQIAFHILLLASLDAHCKCEFETYIAEGIITTNRGVWLEGATVELLWNESGVGEQSVEALTGADGRYFLRFRFYPYNGPAEPPKPYLCDALLEKGRIKVSASGHKAGEADIMFTQKYGSQDLRLVREETDG